MIKERIKSCLLVLLVASSIVLTLNMWINGKLWPNGYNFFSNITNYLSSYNKSYYLSKENISYPEKIIINNLEQRSLYTHTSKQYPEIVDTVLSVIKQSISKYEFTESDNAEWNTALSGSSVYVSYPVAYDTTLICGILDITPMSIKTNSVQEFILVPSVDANSSAVTVYTKDFDTKKVYKAIITADVNIIHNIIQAYATNSLNLLPYSFELNFDRSEDASVEQKVVIDPTVTLRLEGTQLPQVVAENYLTNIYNNNYISSNLLNAFGYNTTNSRSYVDKNNNVVYVENYSTIKIYENGLLEYKSLDPDKGIPLTNSSVSSLYDNFIACIEFVNNLWDSTLPNEPLNINLTSNIVTQTGSRSFKVTMDYYINGYQIMLGSGNGIEITVNNGKITEYKQLFNRFETTERRKTIPSSIDAIDAIFADSTLDGGTISKLNIVYSAKDDIITPVWAAKLDDRNIIIER